MKDRILFHYEAPMEAGGPALAEPAAADPVTDPADPWPGDPAPVGPSPEEWAQTRAELDELRAYLAAQEGPQQEPQWPEIDLLADDAPAQIAALIREEIANAVQPLSQWHEQQTVAEGQARLHDVIADDVARNGEFLFGERASSIVINAARDYYPEAARRYGEGDRAAEAAIARAAAELREAESALRDRIIEQHMNQLTNLAGAGREFGATAQAAQQVTTTPGGDELSLVRKYGGIPA